MLTIKKGIFYFKCYFPWINFILSKKIFCPEFLLLPILKV
nr:MAG TPA: hypothetical protein [Caudoviricetes sp.]